MSTYFLSYARADSATALRFADDLIGAGVSVWVDQYDIRPSQHWDRSVETAVRACAGMVVILSPRSVASPNVADEVSVGINAGKHLIPILIERCTLPLRMTRMQYIDASADYDAALRRCLAGIREHAGAAAPPAADAPGLAADVLAQAERRLTGLMGPISPLLVRQAAARAADAAQLYDILSRSIADAADRESFRGWMVESTGPGQVVTPRSGAARQSAATDVAADDAANIIQVLTNYLGPIAGHVFSREQAVALSREALVRQLAERIPAEKDRAAFLAKTKAG
jgi:hypothetical protein